MRGYCVNKNRWLVVGAIIGGLTVGVMALDNHILIEHDVSRETVVPIMVGLIGPFNNVDSIAMAEHMMRCIGFSGQCVVSVKMMDNKPHKAGIRNFFSQGYPLALFVNEVDGKEGLEWRLYDTLEGHMIGGKRIGCNAMYNESVFDQIVNQVWPLLTGQQGCFGSCIAYCKEVPLKNSRSKCKKLICCSRFDRNNETVLVDAPTIHIGLRWNTDTKKPLLFFSQYTASNVRLMVVNMDKKQRVVSDFDGTNMLPTFSYDGQQVVYCVSKGTGKCQLYIGNKDGIKPLVAVDGQLLSPSFSPDAKTIYCCSDYVHQVPHIYAYSLETGLFVPLTHGKGYAVSPVCHPLKDIVAYTRKIEGYTQLFLWDKKNNKHQQLTFDASDKDSCTWSPCGNYIAYAVEREGKSRIALFMLGCKKQRFITPEHESCTYPAWSPV